MTKKNASFFVPLWIIQVKLWFVICNRVGQRIASLDPLRFLIYCCFVSVTSPRLFGPSAVIVALGKQPTLLSQLDDFHCRFTVKSFNGVIGLFHKSLVWRCKYKDYFWNLQGFWEKVSERVTRPIPLIPGAQRGGAITVSQITVLFQGGCA